MENDLTNQINANPIEGYLERRQKEKSNRGRTIAKYAIGLAAAATLTAGAFFADSARHSGYISKDSKMFEGMFDPIGEGVRDSINEIGSATERVIHESSSSKTDYTRD